MKIVLQWNLRIDRANEYIFRVSRGTSFENLSTQHQPCLPPFGFDVCTDLPKKTLDMSLTHTHTSLLMKILKSCNIWRPERLKLQYT